MTQQKERLNYYLRARLAIVVLTICCTTAQARADEKGQTHKILLGTHIGNATIVSLAGVDTSQAVVRSHRKLDDVIEECARNTATDEDGTVQSEKVAKCAKAGLKEWGDKVLTRRAVCPRSTLYTEFGNHSLIDYVREEDQKMGDHTWRPVRTNWKNHHTTATGYLPHPLSILVQGRVRRKGPLLRPRHTREQTPPLPSEKRD